MDFKYKCILFLLVLIGPIVYIGMRLKIKRKCPSKVKAKVVKGKYRKIESKGYHITIRYNIDGKIYTKEEVIGIFDPYKKGDNIQIQYNPKNPHECYIKSISVVVGVLIYLVIFLLPIIMY